MAELGIYNNSKILEIDEDVQDLLVMDHSPLSNGNNSENEKQIIYFYFILELENSTRYKMLIQSKKVRNLWEVFLCFNKKISAKIFDVISFISIYTHDFTNTPTILNQVKSFNELGIKNFETIFILIKQNIWIIDENPLITQEDYGYKFISNEQSNIIKIFIINRSKIIIIQCSKERKFKEILLYLEAIFNYKNDIGFVFNGKELNRDKTLCELGIKNGNIIVAVDRYRPEIDRHVLNEISLSTKYILKDMIKIKEKNILNIF